MKVIRCRNRDGGVPADAIYIGRPGPLGNPFRMRSESDRERDRVVAEYKIWMEKEVDRNPEFRQQILALRGHDLACWCAPKPCHGDVIISWLTKHKE